MLKNLGYALAYTARTAPFERGRWRIGALAYKLAGQDGRNRAIETVATRHGFRMRLAMSEFVDRTIFATGEWEPLETALIAARLRPGDTFVDVGANIGYFTLLGARLVGPTGRVHAVEANPRTFALLQHNLALNGCSNASAHGVAVGEAAGTARIVSREDGNAGADFAVFDGSDGAGTRIDVVRLDALVRDPRVRLIKIDIEGAEAKALRGATALLAGPHAPDLLFEFTPDFLAQSGDDPRAMIGALAAAGYRICEVTHGGLVEAKDDIYSRRQVYLYCTKQPG
jgi:FkbM family methyltransferase